MALGSRTDTYLAYVTKSGTSATKQQHRPKRKQTHDTQTQENKHTHTHTHTNGIHTITYPTHKGHNERIANNTEHNIPGINPAHTLTGNIVPPAVFTVPF